MGDGAHVSRNLEYGGGASLGHWRLPMVSGRVVADAGLREFREQYKLMLTDNVIYLPK